MQKGSLNKIQQEYVIAHHRQLTALQMANKLNVTEVSVYAACLRMKIIPLTRVKGEQRDLRKQRNKQDPPPKKEPVYKKFYIEKKNIKRHPGIYTNSPSPFGIADELHGNKLYKR